MDRHARERIVTIWWARRDLRLADNEALTEACQHGAEVIPVFVLDPALLAEHSAAERRLGFLRGCLRSLDESLRLRGSRLLVRLGDPATVLSQLMAETGARFVVAEGDPWPAALARVRRTAQNIPLRLTHGIAAEPWVAPPVDGNIDSGKPYRVYTPFSRYWSNRRANEPSSPLPSPNNLALSSQFLALTGITLAAEPASPGWPAGEAAAQERLASFAAGPLRGYATGRDDLGIDGTSRLSPYLRFGCLSARQAVAAADRAGGSNSEGTRRWIGELIWRDFYLQIAYHFPATLTAGMRPSRLSWRSDEASFAAWCEARTGVPLVDAAQRQLLETGWVHNRARMVSASYLVKNLGIDWRWGERFYMQHLIDADPVSNNGGWQWVSGTGADAQPYFRVFNPERQAARFDPDHKYVQRDWLTDPLA